MSEIEKYIRQQEFQESAKGAGLQPSKPKKIEVIIRLNHIPTSDNAYGRTTMLHGEGNTIEEVFDSMDDQMNREHDELSAKKDAYGSIREIFKKGAK